MVVDGGGGQDERIHWTEDDHVDAHDDKTSYKYSTYGRSS